ncbi:MAG: hypothetical protein H0T46_37460 [Deltaproteobacteria bacterium]|nr:hypothetical protein [Deltaproteobacteria bacterium]
MRSLSIVALLLCFGCGSEIGDSCVISSDCDPNGQRYCDISSKEGYCTIQGCDYDTCPEESACIRFFTGNFENRPCDSTSQCTLDELCSLEGHCVARSSEVRYCMRTCDGMGDCRGGYECRDLELMVAHGGEPVLAPGVQIDSSAPKFCAPALR